jgi:hypothetical protein
MIVNAAACLPLPPEMHDEFLHVVHIVRQAQELGLQTLWTDGLFVVKVARPVNFSCRPCAARS